MELVGKDIAEEIKQLDNAIYCGIYGEHGEYLGSHGIVPFEVRKKAKQVWDEKIKNNEEILRAAITLKKNKWDEEFPMGIYISFWILRFHNEVKIEIVQELVNTIYSKKNLRNCKLGNRYSYLMYTLAIPGIKLSDEQKVLVIDAVTTALHTNIPGDKKETCYWILKDSNFSLTEKGRVLREAFPSEDEWLEFQYWCLEGLQEMHSDADIKVVSCYNLLQYPDALIRLNVFDPKKAQAIIDEKNFLQSIFKLRDAHSIDIEERGFQKQIEKTDPKDNID